jgi:hypothetical protein
MIEVYLHKTSVLIKKYELIIILEYNLLYFGSQGSLEVAIGDHSSFKVADLFFSIYHFLYFVIN